MGVPRAVSRPVIIGEVLFDRFPGNVQVLGGAPFNVAWHLQGFGATPLFISRIGDDEAGRRVLGAMDRWGMDQSGLEIDPAHPTGAVDVSLSGGQHSFEILPDQAYDYITTAQLAALTNTDAALLYQGTLIMRTPRMQNRLTEFLRKTDKPLYVDLNLREPWWSSKDLPLLLERATWVKVNDDELDIVAQALDCAGPQLVKQARQVRDSLGTRLLIVTLGEAGAMAFGRPGETATVRPRPTATVVDTVGAGDSFAAVSILGLLHEWPLDLTLQRAQQFANCIIQQRGATSPDHDLYDQMLLDWGVSPS